MPKLPRAPGDRHVRAFERVGWRVNYIEGSHYIRSIQTKEGKC